MDQLKVHSLLNESSKQVKLLNQGDLLVSRKLFWDMLLKEKSQEFKILVNYMIESKLYWLINFV